MSKILCKGNISLVMALTLPVCQAQPAVPYPIGTLGHRYIEMGGGQADPGDDLFDRISFGALRFNFPVSAAVDLSFGGTMHRTRGSTVPGMLSPSADVVSREWAAEMAATAYLRKGIVTPFLRASGEYVWLTQERTWTSGRFGPGQLEHREQHVIGVFGLGAEVFVKRIAVTPSLHYQERYHNVFGTDLGGAWRFDLAVHLWLTTKFGAFMHARRTRPKWDFAEPLWSVAAGARVAF